MRKAAQEESIVADGRDRCLASPEFRQRRDELIRGVWQSYAQSLSEASLLKSVCPHVRVHREIRRRLKELEDELAPQQGHY